MEHPKKDDEFQVLNMKHKMKSIKKKHKANNIGKIEEFTILSNVRPEPEKVVEGFDNPPGITDDDWEGQDDVASQKGVLGNFGTRFANIVTDIYKLVIFANCYVSFSLANFCADGSIQVKQKIDWNFMQEVVVLDTYLDDSVPFHGENLGVNQQIIDDANQVYQYLCFVESLIFAYLFSFGWFYVMFFNYYKKKLNNKALEFGNIGKEQEGICISVQPQAEVSPEQSSSGSGLMDIATAVGTASSFADMDSQAMIKKLGDSNGRGVDELLNAYPSKSVSELMNGSNYGLNAQETMQKAAAHVTGTVADSAKETLGRSYLGNKTAEDTMQKAAAHVTGTVADSAKETLGRSYLGNKTAGEMLKEAAAHVTGTVADSAKETLGRSYLGNKTAGEMLKEAADMGNPKKITGDTTAAQPLNQEGTSDTKTSENTEKCVNPSTCHFFSRENFSKNPNVFTILLMFFIEYSLAIFEWLCFLLETRIPELFDAISVPPAVCYILVVIMVHWFNHNAVSTFKNLIENICTVNYANMILVIFLLIAVFEYASTFFKPDAFFYDSFFQTIAPIAYGLGGFFYLLVLLIKELLRWAVIVLFSIPLGALMCIGYVLYISIITNFQKFSNKSVREGVVRYIRNVIKPKKPEGTTKLVDEVKFEFINILSYVSIFIYNYFIFFILILCSLYGLAYTNPGKPDLLQQIMQYFNMGLLAIVVAMLLYVTKFYTDTGAKNVVELTSATPEKSFLYILERTYYIIFTILIAFFIFVTVAFMNGGNTYFGQMLKDANQNLDDSVDTARRKAVNGAMNATIEATSAITGKKEAPTTGPSDAEKDWNTPNTKASTLGSTSSYVSQGDASNQWNK
jgi:hypothetical protein